MGSDQVGKQELPPELVRRARLFCDLPAQSVHIGEFQHVRAEVDAGTLRLTALGDVLLAQSRGRAGPDLARAAFEEAIRFESPVQTFFRTTTRPTELADVSLAEGQKLLMFLGSANRDPRRWTRPDEYDIERVAAGHVGFRAGIHVCVGQFLAKLEGEVMLQAIAARASSL
jgi:cytochrome P450